MSMNEVRWLSSYSQMKKRKGGQILGYDTYNTRSRYSKNAYLNGFAHEDTRAKPKSCQPQGVPIGNLFLLFLFNCNKTCILL